ncbi:MAG: hypothetical protein ACOYOS_03785 [Syntrophales bacterium]
MLVVKTTLGQSPIHGIGLFADQLISKDDLIARLSPWDVVVKRSELPQQLDDFFMEYVIFKDGDESL